MLVDPARPDAPAYVAEAFPGLESNPENIDQEASIRQMRELGPVGAIALIVLIARSRIYPPELQTDVLSNLYHLWSDRLRGVSSLSSHGDWILVQTAATTSTWSVPAS